MIIPTNIYEWVSLSRTPCQGLGAAKHSASQLETPPMKTQGKDVLKRPWVVWETWLVSGALPSLISVFWCQWSPSYLNRASGVQSCPKRELAENWVTGPQPIQRGRQIDEPYEFLKQMYQVNVIPGARGFVPSLEGLCMSPPLIVQFHKCWLGSDNKSGSELGSDLKWIREISCPQWVYRGNRHKCI